MRFEDLLSRADTTLKNLMPPGTMRLITSIDPKLSYPKNLVKILLNLRSPESLLLDTSARNELLMMLSRKEAQELAEKLDCPAENIDLYSYLTNLNFRKAKDKSTLFEFFEIAIDTPEPESLTEDCMVVCPAFGLFEHQAKALRQVESLLSSGPRRTLLHMPTGSGKTRTAMNVVANYLREHEKGVVVWLAHSEELCEQAADEFVKAWNSLGIRDLPIVRFWGQFNPDLQNLRDGIVIAGLKKAYSCLSSNDLQWRSLSARNPLIVMDEAHQAIAPTYQLIIQQLLRPGNTARLLGLSATPGRTWNDPEEDKRLSEFFGGRKVTLEIEGYTNPVSYLIDKGFLAAPVFKQIEIDSGVSLSASEQEKILNTFELPSSVLDRLASHEQRNLLIIHHAEQLLQRHKRVILFAASVSQSDVLAAVLSARGYWAASVTSKSPLGRAAAIASFKDDTDEPKILINFGVLTTGFDAPRTSAALIARPTFSLVLYSQMVGRAMRGTAAKGNKECEILTVVDTRLPGFDSVVDAFANWEDVWRHTDE